jgi:hypothetical protein
MPDGMAVDPVAPAPDFILRNSEMTAEAAAPGGAPSKW